MPPAAGSSSTRRPHWSIVLFASVAIALFFLGFVAGRLMGREEEVAEGPETWRQAVVEYMSLYTSETFAAVPTDPAIQATNLNAVGAKIGAALTPDRVALPGLSFKLAP